MSEHKYLTDEEIAGLYLSCPPVARPLRSDLAALRAELKAAQDRAEVAERHLSAAEAHEHLLSRIKTEQSAEIARLREQLKDMRKALEPFANCVFNDNGDLTMDQSHLRGGDWLRAYRALNQQPAQDAGEAKR